MVTLRRNSERAVTDRPLSSSHSVKVLSVLNIAIALTSGAPWTNAIPGQYALDPYPQDCDRNQHLPAQAHDLVVAVARKRGAQPQEHAQQQEDLQQQPMGAIAQHGPKQRHRADR